MFNVIKLALLTTIATMALPIGSTLAATLTGTPPIVIGHRGASGYRPEHTLAAYELAIDMGADYIEPDLVITKDGVLVARHEPMLAVLNANGTLNTTDTSTNVYEIPQFADRVRTKVLDGVSVRGWFVEDFTLAELKTLRAIERIPALRPQNTAFDRQFEVPTLQEVIDLAKRKSAETGRTIGIYPETKHPTYFDNLGLSMEEKLVEILTANGYTSANSPVFIQSFEVSNLKDLKTLTNLPLVQLISASGRPYDFVVSGDSRTYADLATKTGLAEIATYASGVGVNKNLLIPRDASGRLLSPTTVVQDAHANNLIVHGWTFRNENTFLPLDFRIGTNPAAQGNAEAEYETFFALGIDGLFSDNPDTAVAVRNRIASVPEPSAALALGAFSLIAWGQRKRIQKA
ncbi:MAG: glycerophosphodiester phosphodiesterase [Leptolyngbyaceae cyanobacterium bins.59]|nr:glycerophosphodiester phosphodiesterase [Leptolyngbyaceae cyanobacterium bins.59]